MGKNKNKRDETKAAGKFETWKEFEKQKEIEMQNLWEPHYEKRTYFYWASRYLEKFEPGKAYKYLARCVSIHILGEEFPLNRVGGSRTREPTSHTTVHTDRYTAVQPHKCKDS